MDQATKMIGQITNNQISHLIQLANAMDVKLNEVKNFFYATESYVIRNKNKFERNAFIDIAFIFAENNIGSLDFYKAAEDVFINSIYNADHNRLHKMLLALLMM